MMVHRSAPSRGGVFARRIVLAAASLALVPATALHAQDVSGTTWSGWTDRGSSVSTGVYARGLFAKDYQVFTTVFLHDSANPVPGTSSGFTNGHKIVGIGIRNNSGTTGSPVILLDPDNNSFYPEALPLPGKSSFSNDASNGDSQWSITYGATDLDNVVIRNTLGGPDFVASKGGADWGGLGQPGLRCVAPAAGVTKVFFDVTQLYTEFGALGSRGANPGLTPLGTTLSFAIAMADPLGASSEPGENGTEAVVRNISLNTAPAATADSYSMDEDTTLNAGSAPPALNGVLPLGVLANDTDYESDVLSATLVSGPSNGVLTLNADGSFSYTPTANWFGTDSFTYKCNDGALDSGNATVTITVNDVPDVTLANFLGFFQPVDNPPVVNAARAGRTVPLKWRITNSAGTGIQVPGLTVSVVSFLTSVGSSAEDEIEVYSGASGLQYLGDGNYQFNWATPSTYANQNRTVRVTVTADGYSFGPASRDALFKFRK